MSRRRLLQSTALLASVGAVGSTETVQATGGDKRWEFETGRGVYSSPTVVDGTVFVGSLDGNLYSLDAESGDQNWMFETGDTVASSPTVVGGTVFVGSNDNNIYAVDTDSGTEQWSVETGSSVNASPTVADGTVFVSSLDGNLYALDAESGSQQWTFESDEPISSSPSVVDETVFVGGRDANVYAVDSESGTTEWSFETKSEIWSSPTVEDGTVFAVSTDDTLYALSTESGDNQWTVEISDAHRSSPTVWDGTVFVGGGTTVYAIDTATGSEQWVFQGDDDIRSSPTVVAGHVFFGSVDNSVYALEVESGSKQWTFETGGRIWWSSPTVVDGTVYIGSADNKVYALDAGVDGSSEGSRVTLGTLGHHHEWANTASKEQPEPSVTPSFTVDPSEPTEGDAIKFDASSSTVENGSLDSYEWDFEDDDSIDESGRVVTHSFGAGSHPVRLAVTTDTGTTNATTQVIEVIPDSSVTADFSIDPTEPTEGETVVFDASTSTVDGGRIETYEWDLTDDGTVDDTGEQTTHSFEPGEHIVTLTLTATDGTTKTTTTAVSVRADPQPEAEFEVTTADPRVDEPVVFDASRSTAPAADIVSYEWDFTGDGSVDKTGERVSYRFDTTTQQVTLTVRDADDREASTQQVIEIGSEPLNVSLTGSSITTTVGETERVTLGVTNLLTSDELTVQLLLETPTGVDLVGVRGADGGSNQYTAVTTLSQAEHENVRIELVANSPGQYEFEAITEYYSGTDKNTTGRDRETITITANSANGSVEGSENQTTEETPGFGIASTVAAIGSGSYVLSSYRSDDTEYK